MQQDITSDQDETRQLQASLERTRRIAATLNDPGDRAALEGHILELERELHSKRRQADRVVLE